MFGFKSPDFNVWSDLTGIDPLPPPLAPVVSLRHNLSLRLLRRRILVRRREMASLVQVSASPWSLGCANRRAMAVPWSRSSRISSAYSSFEVMTLIIWW